MTGELVLTVHIPQHSSGSPLDIDLFMRGKLHA